MPPRRRPPRSRELACTSSTLLPPYGHLMLRHRRTRATTMTRPGIASRRCSIDSLGEAIPATVWRCAMRPVSAPRHCAAYPHTANASSPRKGAGGTLECLFCDYTGPHRDVRPAGAVFPVAVNPVRPSLPLPRHAGHCDDIPMLLECAGTRRRHDCHCAAYGPPGDGTLESARGGGRTTNHYAATLEAAPV
jgi:hypothetical protein